MRSPAAVLLAGLSLLVGGGCVVNAQPSEDSAVEFAACDTFLEHCDELTSFRVHAPELELTASAQVGDRVRFGDLLPNHVVRFELEGLRGAHVLYHARCEIAALPNYLTEADCRDQLTAGPLVP